MGSRVAAAALTTGVDNKCASLGIYIYAPINVMPAGGGGGGEAGQRVGILIF